MHTHRVESFLIYDNVRLEVVHECNPFFAGEPISLILRLKHLGSIKEYEKLKADIHQYHQRIQNELNSKQNYLNEKLNKDENENYSSWSLGSLFRNPFMKENDTTNAIVKEMEQLSMNEEICINNLTHQLEFHKPINLISAFIQITGLFQYNASLIDDNNFKNKDTKIVSIINHNNTNTVSTTATTSSYTTSNHHNGSTVNNNDNTNHHSMVSTSLKSNINNVDNFVKYFNSNFETVSSLNQKTFITPNPNLSYSHDQYNTSDTTNEYNELPLFLIPQTLLFSEIVLQPGEIKTFHFKSLNLPKDLCPSYSLSSNNIRINYDIEFGVNVITHGKIVPVNIKTPIFISPFIDKRSQQYTMTLDGKTHIIPPATVKELPDDLPKGMCPTTPAFSNNSMAMANVGSSSRRRRLSSVSSSFFNNLTDPKNDKHSQKLDSDPINLLKQNFVNIIKENVKTDFDIDQLVETQLNYQFQKNEDGNEIMVTDFDLIQGTEKNITRNNISNFKRSLPDIDTQNTDNVACTNTDNGDKTNQENKLLPQLNSNLQRKFIVNRDGKSIAQIKLSKFFYTIADDIHLVIYPEPNSKFQISAFKVSLQCVELFNKKYVMEKDQTRPFYKTICEAHAVSFDKTDSLPLTLVLPRTPMSHLPSQFKTNIFEIKWVLKFTFILIDKKNDSTEETSFYNNHLDKFYEDKKGALYHSKESLEGLDFTFRVPIDILPSDADFSGL